MIGAPRRAHGERCCAVVIVRDGAEPPTLDDIVAFCRTAGLATRRSPSSSSSSTELPRNASGKVLKYELQAQLG